MTEEIDEPTEQTGGHRNSINRYLTNVNLSLYGGMTLNSLVGKPE